MLTSRRRHTRFVSVTGVQTCALPIYIFVLLVGVGVLVGIHADAQPIHVVADLGTGVSVMLADTAGEHDGVNTAHSGNVAADGLLDLVVQHIAGQLCARVAGGGCCLNVTLVAGNARSEEHTSELQSR